MNFTIRNIARYTLTLIALVTSVAAGSQRLPLAHSFAARQFSEENPLVEQAFSTVRMASPFAALLQENSVDEATSEEPQIISKMTDFAARFLGTRYRRGAAGPSSFDCSGFTSYIFKNFGFTLNRDSRSQYLQGEKVSTDELKPGDLMFFSSRSSGRGRVGHVAMVVDVNPDGSCTFIHASTSRGVVYQRFPDGGYYQRNYLGAKRIIGTKGFSAS